MIVSFDFLNWCLFVCGCVRSGIFFGKRLAGIVKHLLCDVRHAELQKVLKTGPCGMGVAVIGKNGRIVCRAAGQQQRVFDAFTVLCEPFGDGDPVCLCLHDERIVGGALLVFFCVVNGIQQVDEPSDGRSDAISDAVCGSLKTVCKDLAEQYRKRLRRSIGGALSRMLQCGKGGKLLLHRPVKR